jgi:hypothetical protein
MPCPKKRAKLTQAMSETGIMRTRHAVSLHSQTKGRPSSPPCQGRISYKRKTNLINGKLRPIRSSVGTRLPCPIIKRHPPPPPCGVLAPVSGGEFACAVGNEQKQKSITTSRFLSYEESANEMYTAPQIKTKFCPRYSHTLVYSILTPLYIVLSRPCPREDYFVLSQRR